MDDFDRDDIYSGELEAGDDDDDNDMFQATSRSAVVQNQPHDEEINLSESESFAHDDPPAVPRDASLIESHDMDEMPSRPGGGQTALQRNASPMASSGRGGGDAGTASPGSPPAAGGGGGGAAGGSDSPAGAYNPADYAYLNVPEDVRNLFQYITRYKPKVIELETKLKPFIPDYIPSIGGIDEFIKVPRPDAKPDFLGLKVLDEPAVKQSDPTVLTLQLRTLSKEAPGSKAEMVGRIEHCDDGKQKKIAQWIASITEIHKSKPPATVSYSRRMPDIDGLMAEWPPEMETFLKNMKMPNGDVDVDLKTFSKLICALLDIPVHDNIIESLHVLFTLYSEFKSNPVFKQMFDLDDNSDPGEGLGGSANVWTSDNY